MALSIIGAGLGRTGTLSLKRALEQLTFKPCFHAVDLTASSVDPIYRLLNSNPIDWDKVFDGYLAAVDWPAYLAYRELADRYPSAKVILTVRDDPNAWFESYQAIRHVSEGIALSEGAQSLINKIASGFFGDQVAQLFRLRDRTTAITVYEQHNAKVQNTIALERLLVFNVKQGWGPLCGFLNVPLPNIPFPHVNSRTEYPALLTRFMNG